VALLPVRLVRAEAHDGGAEAVIADLRFTPTSPAVAESGLLAWASCRLGPIRVQGLAVRRTLSGHLSVTFPSRRDRRGRKHEIVAPLDRATRREIEAAILAVWRNAAR
jgi:DNA-binding cell septation regulator SpoVG